MMCFLTKQRHKAKVFDNTSGLSIHLRTEDRCCRYPEGNLRILKKYIKCIDWWHISAMFSRGFPDFGDKILCLFTNTRTGSRCHMAFHAF
jgi:hypothetical protein